MTKKHPKSKEQEETPEEKVTQKTENELSENDIEEQSEKKDNGSCQEEKSELEIKIEQTEKELAEYKDKHIRLIAEYDNYRKRTLKEKMELSKTAGVKVITEMLPVVDDFERALQHLDKASDLDAVKDGINIIYNKFIKFLSLQGIKEIETANQEFNADIHEAITKIPAPSEELKGKIIDCVQKGYLLDEKVIRYPKVVVGE